MGRVRFEVISSSAGTRSRDILFALRCFSKVFASMITASALPFTVSTTGRPVRWIRSRISRVFLFKSVTDRISSVILMDINLAPLSTTDLTLNVASHNAHHKASPWYFGQEIKKAGSVRASGRSYLQPVSLKNILDPGRSVSGRPRGLVPSPPCD